MGILAEAFIAAFDSSTELTWITGRPGQSIARFEVPGFRVDTNLTETKKNEWRAGFEVISRASASEGIRASIRVFRGMFQVVREFLEVRHPENIVFASKGGALGRLYKEYLQRQDIPLRQMGYRMIPPVKLSLLAEFALEKTKPSEWKDRDR